MSGCDYGILTGNLFPEPRSTDEATLTEPEPGWTSGPTDRPADTTARARFRDASSIAYTSWAELSSSVVQQAVRNSATSIIRQTS